MVPPSFPGITKRADQKNPARERRKGHVSGADMVEDRDKSSCASTRHHSIATCKANGARSAYPRFERKSCNCERGDGERSIAPYPFDGRRAHSLQIFCRGLFVVWRSASIHRSSGHPLHVLIDGSESRHGVLALTRNVEPATVWQTPVGTGRNALASGHTHTQRCGRQHTSLPSQFGISVVHASGRAHRICQSTLRTCSPSEGLAVSAAGSSL
jgi:hypothetical protein